jgi:hypothetical protein
VVTWVCDPVHGNTETCNGFKTRRYENIRAEVEAFFDVHDAMGSVPGGVHLEMTGEEKWRGGGRALALVVVWGVPGRVQRHAPLLLLLLLSHHCALLTNTHHQATT